MFAVTKCTFPPITVFTDDVTEHISADQFLKMTSQNSLPPITVFTDDVTKHISADHSFYR